MHGFHLGFLHWIKESVGLDEQGLITKTQSLAAFSCPWRAVSHNSLLCGQASASCKSLSLVNLVRPLHWFWWDVRGIHIQLKPLKLIPVMDAYKVVHPGIVFKRRIYRTHLQCENMIYFLAIFWKNFLNLIFFLGDVDSHRTSGSYNFKSTRINGSHVFSSNMF